MQANKSDLSFLISSINIFYIVVEFSVHIDSHVLHKIQEKHGEYADCIFTMTCLHCEYEVIRHPIVLGDLSGVPPDLFTQIMRIPKFSTNSTALAKCVMQKAAVFGSLHILQKVLGGSTKQCFLVISYRANTGQSDDIALEQCQILTILWMRSRMDV